MVVSATVRRIRRSRSASRTMDATRRASFPCSRLPVPCESHQPAVVSCPLTDARLSLTYYSVTAVGGTIHVPETAVFFSGGGFSDVVRTSFFSITRSADCVFHIAILRQFPRPAYQEAAVSKFLKTLPKGTYEGLFNPNGRVRQSTFSDCVSQPAHP